MSSSPPVLAQRVSPPASAAEDATALFSAFSRDDHPPAVPATSSPAPQQHHDEYDDEDDNSSGGGSGKRNSSEDNFKTGRWTRVEHDRFIQAFTAYDKDWRKVSEFVGTRSNIQCRTHAQKHFKGLAARELKAKAKSMQTTTGTGSGLAAHSQMLQQPQFLAQFSIPQQQQAGANNVGMYFPVGYPPQMYYMPQHPWAGNGGGTPAQFAPGAQQLPQQSNQHSPPPSFTTMPPPPPAGYLPGVPNFASPPATKSTYAVSVPKPDSTTSSDTSAGVEALLSLF